MNKKNLFILAIVIIFGLPLLGAFTTGFTVNKLTRQSGTSVSSVPMMGRSRVGMAETAPMMGQPAPAVYKQDSMMPADYEMPPINMNTGFTPGVDRTIVKTANLSLLVKDTRDAVEQVSDATQAVGGTVTLVNIYEHEFEKGVVRADMTVRVPVDKLETTMADIKRVADKVTAENITADDRTEQKVDMEAQLKNLRATETQLLTIMNQAKTVEETLEVQRELNNVRGQIERMQAQLDNLVGDAAMSTLHISLSTKESELPVIDPANRTLWEEVKLAARDAVRLYRTLFVAGVRLLILGLPVLVIGSVGYWVWKRR